MSEMMDVISWKFPDNNYTTDASLDTSDTETFMKDPVASLAREICQNSIDAARGDDPVIVEFSTFTIHRSKIPNIDELTTQIVKCYDYYKDSPQDGKELGVLKKSIEKEEITCLRVSDFNTKGVEGAVEFKRGTPFYNLTKGSGISGKIGVSGGSKGIGKFASFVVSTTNTVFYSTSAIDGVQAHIGISKLCSVPISDDDDLVTMGIGYYAKGKKNLPILEQLSLDPSFTRQKEQYGTDVYLIGFDEDENWKNEVISKILESFMVAIVKGRLEVQVGDILVNQSTVSDILQSTEFKQSRPRTEMRDVWAQYELLQEGEEIHKKEFDIQGSTITVYVKQYGQDEEQNATKKCVMVRYPYMKITDLKMGGVLPYSALCLLHKDDLTEKLRAIENPQHTDWEFKRLNRFPKLKRETHLLKLEMEKTVQKYIAEILQQGSSDETDLIGAGEFLPSQDEIGTNAGSVLNNDQILINPVSSMKIQNPKTERSGDSGEGYDFDQGDESDSGESGRIPKKKKKKPNPNPNPKPAPKPEDPPIGPGEKPVLKKVPISGMRYRTVITDKSQGDYHCIFTSMFTESDCDFAIMLCGEGTDKYPVKILSASINGEECTVKDGKIVNLKIEKGEKYTISYRVDSQEMFASEVIMNAYR